MTHSGMKKYLKFLENGVTIEINIPLGCVQEYNSFYWMEYISYTCHLYCNNGYLEFEKTRADSSIPCILYGIKDRPIVCRKQTFFKNGKCCHHKITILPISEYNNQEDILKFCKGSNIRSVDFHSLIGSEDDQTSYNDSVAVEKVAEIREPKRKNSNCETQRDKVFITHRFGQNFIQRNHQYFTDTMVVTYRSLPTNAITLYEHDLHQHFNFYNICDPDVKHIALDLYQLSPSSDYYYFCQSYKQPELNVIQELIPDLNKERNYNESRLTANSAKHNHFGPNFQRMSSPDPKASDALLNNYKWIFDENELKSLSEIREGTNFDFSESQNGYERINETLLTAPCSTPNKQTSPVESLKTKERFTKILSKQSHMVKCPVPYCEAFFQETKKHMSNFHSDLPKWKQKFYCDITIYNKTEMNYPCHICPLCHSIQFHMKWHLAWVHNVSVNSTISKDIRQTSETIILTHDRFFMEVVINAFECYQLQNGGIEGETVMRRSGHVRDFLLILSKDEVSGKLFWGKVLGSNLFALISILCDQRVFNQQTLSEQLRSLQQFCEFLHCNLDMFLPVGTSWLQQIFPSWYILELTESEIFLVACKT